MIIPLIKHSVGWATAPMIIDGLCISVEQICPHPPTPSPKQGEGETLK